MGLHSDMGIEMVKSAIGFLAPIPTALIHAFYLLVASSRPLVLRGAGNGYK